MMLQIERCYEKPQAQVEEIDQSNGRIPWFNSKSGRPNFEPHPLNVREQGTVVDEYMMSILEHGVVQDNRG
eukprot:15458642-Alexandrium_andersonii.AAC.1